MYNSPLNEARGLPDDGDQYETDNIEDDDVTELDDLDILMSGDITLTRTLGKVEKIYYQQFTQSSI